ncbi:acyl-CoA synthetase FdrA [Microvirga massiliensis]|uniref:acyl-CoA synthetase FdrA n=1 Tax=Microvirga massiliensis TaxID=1033741 RepID=UPI00062B301F|nr:acyl-CoA synthetase FdrA [Microvirga massiliensis]
MSEFVLNEIRKGFYLDSVALMRLSRAIAERPGITEAALMMGTPSNRQILADAGLLAENGASAQGNDLIIGIRAESEGNARDALREALAQLEQPRPAAGETESWKPRTLRAALRLMPDANVALISVPGEFAAAEARKALNHGLHAMIFSDNVPVAKERALKEEARALGRLVMGPDCGTAIIGGVPLAFANRVRRGEIGVIGASGTGIQEVTSLISEAGGGISHAVGVGGRDLNQAVGGITTLMAIDALDADPATRHIVLISKPPHPDVARMVLARVARSTKPFTVCFLGGNDAGMPANARFAGTLKAAAEAALGGVVIGTGFKPSISPSRQGIVAGLYSGGTLCAEAQIVLLRNGRQVASNAAVPGSRPLTEANGSSDRIVDLGADEYTKGRPHPMIDPSVRDDMLRKTLEDPGIGAILVDLVIGFGAHIDPAGHLASILSEFGPSHSPVVASVTGTEEDPQVRSWQIAILKNAGVVVAPSNEQAAEVALALCQG